jgi:hypothetical protein
MKLRTFIFIFALVFTQLGQAADSLLLPDSWKAPLLSMMAGIKKGGELKSTALLKSSHEALVQSTEIINKAVRASSEEGKSSEELTALFKKTQEDLEAVARSLDEQVERVSTKKIDDIRWNQDYANDYIKRAQANDPRIAYILSSYFNPLLYCSQSGGSVFIGYFLSGGLGLQHSECASTNGNRYKGLAGDVMIGAGVGAALGYNGGTSCGLGERPNSSMDNEFGAGLVAGAGGHGSSNSGRISGTRTRNGGLSLGLYLGFFNRLRFNHMNEVINLENENDYALAMFVSPDLTDQALMREFSSSSKSRNCPQEEISIDQSHRLGQRAELRERFVETYINTERRRAPTGSAR